MFPRRNVLNTLPVLVIIETLDVTEPLEKAKTASRNPGVGLDRVGD